MTITEAAAELTALGIRKGFRPQIDDSGAMLLATKTPAQIVAGDLVGCEIAKVAGGFRVWTSQDRKARKLAEQHGLAVRCWSGEADLIVPDALADELLPQLGARVRRELSEEQRQTLRARLANARIALSSIPKPTQEGTPEGLTA